MATQSHESLTSFRRVQASSSRKFGVTVGAILCFLALWPVVRHPLVHDGAHPRTVLLAIGVVLVVLGLVAPRVLDPLNALWFKLGMVLTRITNPIVMGIMYFAAVVPLGWLLRRQGKDLLRLRRSAEAESYWIDRTEPASPLTKQF